MNDELGPAPMGSLGPLRERVEMLNGDVEKEGMATFSKGGPSNIGKKLLRFPLSRLWADWVTEASIFRKDGMRVLPAEDDS